MYKKTLTFITSILLAGLLACGCSSEAERSEAPTVSHARYQAPLESAGPPADIEWLTNDSDPLFASSEAAPGGRLDLFVSSFPVTFRVVGPDSNSSFRSAILGNQLGLTSLHPNTENLVPEIATHWAFDDDKQTMYFKLNPRARWSDGEKVTAHDFAYTLEFMRSPHIIAPWYNDYYTSEIDRVIVYDDHTLAVRATKTQPDLHLKVSLQPTPSHFYGPLDDTFVQKFNWKISPNTGPYRITDFQKGRYVEFTKNDDWWARDLRYFKNRFNVDQVVYTVIRDFGMAWEHFKQAEIDVFALTMPQFWHVKSRTPVIDNGYVNRIWFFNDTQQSAQGLWLNLNHPLFSDKRVRYAFAHAMNVDKVIEKVLRGDYFRLEHGFMGYGEYSNDNIRARRFDLDRVTEYMEAAGFHRGRDGIWEKDGLRFSVTVSYGFEGHTPRLVVLKEEARKAGIELNLRQMDPSAAFKQILEKKHDVAWMGWSTSLRPQYWEHFHSVNAHVPQTNNITNTDDPLMDKLIMGYRDSLEEEERIRLSRRIQARIHEIGCFVPTFMIPYVRQAYWRWWRLPDPPGTRHTNDLFEPFAGGDGGLFWFDRDKHEAAREAMRRGEMFEPTTIVDETFFTGEK